jgi:hypothetical protein
MKGEGESPPVVRRYIDAESFGYPVEIVIREPAVTMTPEEIEALGGHVALRRRVLGPLAKVLLSIAESERREAAKAGPPPEEDRPKAKGGGTGKRAAKRRVGKAPFTPERPGAGREGQNEGGLSVDFARSGHHASEIPVDNPLCKHHLQRRKRREVR